MLLLGETVNFKNMNAILNYVTGRQGSEIFGALNGQGVHDFFDQSQWDFVW